MELEDIEGIIEIWKESATTLAMSWGGTARFSPTIELCMNQLWSHLYGGIS